MSDDQLTVQSVTGVDMTLTLAGPGSRSYAFVIDWHIRLLLALAWLFLTAVLGRLSTHVGTYEALFTTLPASVIYFLYHPILEVVLRGRTPGKRMARVRLVNRQGGAPSTLALVIRNLFRVIDSLPVAYVIGLISCIVTRHHVRIGDMAAGTLLVIDRSEDERSLTRLEPVAGASQLPLETLELVDQILERWDSLEPKYRARIAWGLLARVAPIGDESQPQSQEQLHARLKALLKRPEESHV